MRALVSEVPLMYGIVAVARARVGLSVGISVTVSVPSNKVRVVIETIKRQTGGQTERYTRSNAATARFLTLVKPAET